MSTEFDDRDDTAAILVGDDDIDGTPVSNGKIVPEVDAQGRETGYKVFIPTDDERKRMATRIEEELTISEAEYAPVWAQMSRNKAAYEALPDKGDPSDFLQLPVGKTSVNHLVGFFVNRIYGKDPICTIVPEEYGDYEVPIPSGRDPMTGEIVSRIEMRSAEELAEHGERLMTSYLKGGKIPFHRFLYDIVMDCVRGMPPWGKTCYDRVTRPQLVPKWKRLPDNSVIADGYQEVERVVGSPHKLQHLSGFNVLMPSPWLDPQEAEMIFEHVPHTLAEGRNKVRQHDWYLVDDEDWDKLKKSVSDLKRYEGRDESEKVRKQDRPRNLLDVYHVPIYWPCVFDDDQGQTLEGIFSLQVAYERNTNTVLSAHMNPYAHGRRNIVPYYQRPKVDEIGGYSTMEDVLPLQKVKTRLFHSQVQNAMLANTVWTKVRPGSTAWQWLKGNEIRARSKVPVTNKDDLTSEVLGRELRSLAPEIGAISAWEKEITVSDTVKGATLLGRTSRAAISLVQEAGLTVPNMDLDFIREQLGQNLTMLYHNLGQWAIYGEEIPFRNPETRALVMKAIAFPLEGLGGFQVRISASSDEETAQFEFERDLGLAKLQGEKAMEAAQIFGPIINPKSSPMTIEFSRRQLVANQLLLARIYELAKIDPKKYTMTEREIDEMVKQQRQWVMQQMQLQFMQQQAAAQGGAGGGNVVQGAFGGGAVPPNPAEQQGMESMGGAPSNAGPAPTLPAGGL